MKSKLLVSTLALATMLGAGLALPTAVSAHEVVREKHVQVIRNSDHYDRHHHRRHRDSDRWYVQRHRDVKSRWAPHDHHGKHHGKHHKKHCKKHGNENVRYERRVYREVQPVEHRRVYRRHSDDSLRIHIGYDLVM